MWARLEGVSSTLNDEVGAVQGVHLFRETGGIHHEFVLIRLGGVGITSSWLRIERAARFKQHWHRLQLDSFGPVFAGVALRESVSFGRSKAELLFQQADEIGSIEIVPERYVASAPLYLAELVDQIRNISDTSPLYHLLTHNCRWFARQTLLTLAQRQNRLAPGSFKVLWHDMPSSYSDLSRMVSRDRFGGRPVEGKEGAWIHALSLCRAADAFRLSGRNEEALALCAETLPAMSSMVRSKPTDKRKSILTGCLLIKQVALQHLNRSEESIIALQEVVNVIHARASPANAYNMGTLKAYQLMALGNYSSLLASQGHLEMAEETLHTAVNGWRAYYDEIRCTSFAPHVARVCLQVGGHWALQLARIGKFEQAFSEAEAAVRGMAGLHQTRRDVNCFDLAWLLQLFADVLQLSGRLGEAYLVSALCIHFYEEEFASRPESCQSSFAVALQNHANLADRMGPLYYEIRDASDLCAIKHTRELYKREPHTYRANLAKVLGDRFQCLTRSDLVVRDRPNIGVIMFEKKHAQTLVNLIQESTGLYRILVKQDPVFFTHFLLKDLKMGAELMTVFGLADDAALYSKEFWEVAASAQTAGIDVTTPKQIRVFHTRST